MEPFSRGWRSQASLGIGCSITGPGESLSQELISSLRFRPAICSVIQTTVIEATAKQNNLQEKREGGSDLTSTSE